MSDAPYTIEKLDELQRLLDTGDGTLNRQVVRNLLATARAGLEDRDKAIDRMQVEQRLRGEFQRACLEADARVQGFEDAERQMLRFMPGDEDLISTLHEYARAYGAEWLLARPDHSSRAVSPNASEATPTHRCSCLPPYENCTHGEAEEEAYTERVMQRAGEREVHETPDEIVTLRRAVAFFASVIKSGEPWSDVCEDTLRATRSGQRPSSDDEYWDGIAGELGKYRDRP